MSTYIHTTQEAGKAFYLKYRGKGKVSMLNLLKFREIADYNEAPDLKPDAPISGEEAYRLYMEHTLPLLEAAGSKVLYFGSCGPFLIGPQAEQWDAIILVEHASAERFIAFAQNPDYLRIAGHRTAALLNSRLLPVQQNLV